MGIESIVIETLKSWLPGEWQRKGFKKALRKFVLDNIDNEALESVDDIVNEIGRYLPDLFLIDKKLVVIEVEDTSKLSEPKLQAYCRLWDALDYYSLEMELYVTDRYGLNPQKIPLMEFMLTFIKEASVNRS